MNNDEITAEVAARHNIYAIVDLIEISCILNRVNSSVVVRLSFAARRIAGEESHVFRPPAPFLCRRQGRNEDHTCGHRPTAKS